MSTTNLEHNELITCDLCKRRYNINVYKRHRNENQCVKRNHHRLPFESIKQRSIQIGDKIFSVQQKSSEKTNDTQISNRQDKRKQQISNHHHKQQHQEKLQRILPINNHRRTLEQAKQLLQRRIKYLPPWIQKRPNITKEYRTNIQAKGSFHNIIDRQISPKKSHSRERPPPPTTKFKNDDLPIKSNPKKTFISVSDRRNRNHLVPQQPIITKSPKIRTSQKTNTSKNQSNRIDQTNSASQSIRKAYTWTRSSKQTTNRDVISPIHIPTFYESSSGPFHDRIPIPINQNYDDDEFERYSPSPISTPKYPQNKQFLPNIILHEQQTFIRPNTYQKPKRSNQRMILSRRKMTEISVSLFILFSFQLQIQQNQTFIYHQ